MSGLKAKLTQKIGPLPAFAWVLLLVGGYLAYRKFSGGTSANTTATDAETVDPGIIGSGVGADAGGAGTDARDLTPIPLDPGQSVYDPGSGKLIVGPTPAPDTNVEPAQPSPAVVTPPNDAAPGTSGQHPGSSSEIVSSVLHRAAISHAVVAAAKSSPLKSKPVAHVLAKTKPVSPAVAPKAAKHKAKKKGGK